MPGAKTTLALALAALAAAIVAAFVHLRPALPDAARVGDPVLPDLVGRTADVARLTVTTATDRFTLVRDGDGWIWEERNGFPVPAERVEATLAALAALRLAAPLTIRPDRYERLGLTGIVDPDSRTLRLDAEAAGGEPLGRILLGDRRRGGLEGRYVRQAFAARSWLAEGEIEVRADPIAWLDRRLVDLAPEHVAEIAVEDAEGGRLRLSRPAPDAAWTLADGAAIAAPVAADLAGLMTDLELVDLAAADTRPDAADTLSVTLAGFDGLSIRARFLLAPDGAAPPWVRLGAGAAGDAADGVRQAAAALDRRLGGWIYRLSPERLDRFARALAALHAAVAPTAL